MEEKATIMQTEFKDIGKVAEYCLMQNKVYI